MDTSAARASALAEEARAYSYELFDILNRVSTSFRRYPKPLLNLSPNSAFREFERLPGSPAFGSRISSLSAALRILSSASSASSSAILAAAASPSMRTAPLGAIVAPPAALRAHEDTTSPDATPSLRATAAGAIPLRSSDSASRLVASG